MSHILLESRIAEKLELFGPAAKAVDEHFWKMSSCLTDVTAHENL